MLHGGVGCRLHGVRVVSTHGKRSGEIGYGQRYSTTTRQGAGDEGPDLPHRICEAVLKKGVPSVSHCTPGGNTDSAGLERPCVGHGMPAMAVSTVAWDQADPLEQRKIRDQTGHTRPRCAV